MNTKIRTTTLLTGAAAFAAILCAPAAAARTSCILPPDQGNMVGTPCVPIINSDSGGQAPAQAPEQFALGGLHHQQ